MTFMEICVKLSSLSHDEKMKVATIIITSDFREICAIGLNGNYRGAPHERESMETGKSGFTHSEANALIHLCKPFELRPSLIMLCTHKPCPACAKLCVNAGIVRVVYLHDYDAMGDETDEIFERSGVELNKLEELVSDAA